MPVLYKTIQSTMKTKDGDKLYHPRTVYVGSVNTEKIAQEIAEYSSLSKGDVKNSIDNLVTVMTRHLQSSEVVMLDGLGTFRLAMKSRGKEQRPKKKYPPRRPRCRYTSVRLLPAIRTVPWLPAHWWPVWSVYFTNPKQQIPVTAAVATAAAETEA